MNLDYDPTQVLEASDEELARNLWKSGALLEASELYERLLAQPRHRGNARVWIDAGRLSDEMGRMGEAEARLRHAAALPDGDEARVALALTTMHRGAFAEAAGLWRRLARMPRHEAQAWAGLAVCAHLAGHPRVVRRCEKKLDAVASRQERRRLLAEMWVHGAGSDVEVRRAGNGPTGRPSPLTLLLRESSRTLRRHAARHAERADAHYHLAVCAEALDEREHARAAVTRAVKINPRYTAALALRARIAA